MAAEGKDRAQISVGVREGSTETYRWIKVIRVEKRRIQMTLKLFTSKPIVTWNFC